MIVSADRFGRNNLINLNVAAVGHFDRLVVFGKSVGIYEINGIYVLLPLSVESNCIAVGRS